MILWASCDSETNRALSLNERRHLDSLIAQHQQRWNLYYDSICTIQQDSLIHYYFDSLIRQEYQTMKKLEQ